MILDRRVDYIVRTECEREGIDPRALLRLLENLPAETLEHELGLRSADFDLEKETEKAYDDGVEDGRKKHEEAIDAAIRDLSRLGRVRDVRALIQQALETAASDLDDRDHFVELMFDAIDELVDEAAKKAARKGRAKALARLKVGRARRVKA